MRSSILGHHDSTVFGLDFSPDGGLLVSASLDHTAKVWDLAPLQVIVEEAGGRVTDFDGGALPCAASAYVAGGEAAHRRLLDFVQGARARLS
mgnify:CR=1 FL=1